MLYFCIIMILGQIFIGRAYYVTISSTLAALEIVLLMILFGASTGFVNPQATNNTIAASILVSMVPYLGTIFLFDAFAQGLAKKSRALVLTAVMADLVGLMVSVAILYRY